MLGWLLVHGARRDPQAQLKLPFIGDTPLPPREVLRRDLPDERLQLPWERGPSRGREAVPEPSAPLAPPPPECLRWHPRQRLTPAEPVAEPDERAAGGVGSALWLAMVGLVPCQRLTQEEVFCRARGGGAQTEP
jgi:hypothetical protein